MINYYKKGHLVELTKVSNMHHLDSRASFITTLVQVVYCDIVISACI